MGGRLRCWVTAGMLAGALWAGGSAGPEEQAQPRTFNSAVALGVYAVTGGAHRLDMHFHPLPNQGELVGEHAMEGNACVPNGQSLLHCFQPVPEEGCNERADHSEDGHFLLSGGMCACVNQPRRGYLHCVVSPVTLVTSGFSGGTGREGRKNGPQTALKTRGRGGRPAAGGPRK